MEDRTPLRLRSYRPTPLAINISVICSANQTPPHPPLFTYSLLLSSPPLISSRRANRRSLLLCSRNHPNPEISYRAPFIPIGECSLHIWIVFEHKKLLGTHASCRKSILTFKMNSLSLSPAPNLRVDGSSYVSGSHIHLRRGLLGSDQWKGPLNQGIRVWWKHLGSSTTRNGCRFSVAARIKKENEYPWPEKIDPNLESEHLSYLSHFKPLKDKPKPVTLDFEKPLIELQKKIMNVRKMAEETGLDFTDQIIRLEKKYQQALEDLYIHLTPIQRLSIARHPNRPTFLDHVLNITDKWVELHGDRAGYDDPAIVTGLGSMDGKTYMFIGHQKGRNTKENIKRNFGMPTPHGYRKALRMMRYADHHGFPIITFIDTPGAFADLKSEELGQGEAIAFNLRAMFGLKVPIVTVVIGEGGSGGALAIGCANKLYMLDNSVFYVARDSNSEQQIYRVIH